MTWYNLIALYIVIGCLIDLIASRWTDSGIFTVYLWPWMVFRWIRCRD